MSDKLNITNEMAVFDRKDRDFYDSLTDEERKKFSTFLMIRWGSCVSGNRELQEYYVQSCNHYLNKHFFALSKHPKLQWLMATAVSPGLGTQRHNWIAPKKKATASDASSMKKQLAELFPNMKPDELEVMAAITTKKELNEYIQAHGNNK